MNLGHWLSVGRSLCEAKDRPHRYRLPATPPLPNFGPTDRNDADGTLVPAESAASGPLVATTMPTTNAVETAPAPPEQSAKAPRAARLWRLRWRGNPFRSKPAADAEAVRRAVQAELLLDNVKPLRNDLSDADLELRPLSEACAEAARKASRNPFLAPATERTPWWRRGWNLLSRRWLGAGRE